MPDRFCRTIEDANVQFSERAVIDAARKWANDIDHRDHDLLTVLRRAVRSLEQSEHERSRARLLSFR